MFFRPPNGAGKPLGAVLLAGDRPLARSRSWRCCRRAPRFAVPGSGRLRLRRRRRHRRAEGGVLRLAGLQQEPPDLLGDLRVLGDVGAGLVAPLADPFAAERIEGARLLEEPSGRRRVDHLAGGVDADAVEDVELGLSKGGATLFFTTLTRAWLPTT